MCKMGRCRTTTEITPPADLSELRLQRTIMGTPESEPRRNKISFRLTDKEMIQLKAQMANLDYLSVSRFTRDKLLDRQLEIRRNITLTDRNLRNQINIISASIAKVGVDYNQATKLFNTLNKRTRSDGSPVINARAANYYLKMLYNLTKELKQSVDTLIDMVDHLNYDNIPHGEGDNNSKQ